LPKTGFISFCTSFEGGMTGFFPVLDSVGSIPTEEYFWRVFFWVFANEGVVGNGKKMYLLWKKSTYYRKYFSIVANDR